MIVGVGLLATLQLVAAGTGANIDGARTTTAINLARSIRELTLKKTFTEMLEMDGETHSPPVDSRGVAIAGFNQWEQVMDVQSVDPDRITTDIVDPAPDVVRVTVTVRQNAKSVYALSWYRFKPTP